MYNYLDFDGPQLDQVGVGARNYWGNHVPLDTVTLGKKTSILKGSVCGEIQHFVKQMGRTLLLLHSTFLESVSPMMTKREKNEGRNVCVWLYLCMVTLTSVLSLEHVCGYCMTVPQGV